MLISAPVQAAVTSSSPVDKAGYGGIKWQSHLSSDSGFHNSTPPVIEGSRLFSAAGKTLYMLNKDTGKTIASAKLTGSVYYGSRPVTYSDGTVYVSENGGTIQAFAVSGSTLTKKWTSTKSYGGQNVNAITCGGGNVYVGFWSGNSAGTFVCLDASTGAEKWTTTHDGGYYWTKAYASGSYVVVGSDGKENDRADNTNSGTLYSFSASTGDEVDSVSDFEGSRSIRSGITYDSGYVYFTCKNGRLYKVGYDTGTGKFGTEASVSVGAYSGSTYSTSTPVIYGGTAYIGTQGEKIIAVDTATMKIKTEVKTTAPVVDEVLVSSGTESGASGGVTVYAAMNSSTGGIYFADISSDGSVTASGTLFTPVHKQYCSCGITAESGGTLYYRNDSGYTMAVTNCPNPVTVKTAAGKKKIKVTWSKAVGTTSYEVWRASSKSGKYTKVKTTSSRSWTNTKLKKGKKYYYKVKAVRGSGSAASKSIFSNISYKKAK
jgi:outer membrane protein assembly factor BamB